MVQILTMDVGDRLDGGQVNRDRWDICNGTNNKTSKMKNKIINEKRNLGLYFLVQGCQTHFHGGPHQPHGCLQRAECSFRTVHMQLLLNSLAARQKQGLGRIKQGGGLDMAHGPCVCHLCPSGFSFILKFLNYVPFCCHFFLLLPPNRSVNYIKMNTIHLQRPQESEQIEDHDKM